MTSLTRAALLLGRFLSGALAQLLVCLEVRCDTYVTRCHENITIIMSRSNQVCSYRDLNYISLAMVTAATMVSFLLPPVSSTIYFHTGEQSGVDIYL